MSQFSIHKKMRHFLNSNIKNICKIIYRSAHLKWSPNTKLSKKIWDRYRKLPIADCKAQATYIWIDGTGEILRIKTRTLDFAPSCLKDCPVWGFNGSATYQAEVSSSDILLSPVALYKDPITQGNNKLVLCETFIEGCRPTPTNHRIKCAQSLFKVCNKDPMFSFEQEFHFMDVNERPFGWPKMLGEPSPYTDHYGVVGAEHVHGREIIECVYRACLFCGVEISGCNSEIVPGQWELRIGPSIGIKAADDVWVARYILQRIAEDFGVGVSFHPKMFHNWKGSGLHTNFSTKEMRADGGYKFIEEAIKKLEKKHTEHMKIFNPYCPNKKFTTGVGDRTASIRISKMVATQKKGYFEDRRPKANVDPYLIIKAMVETVC